MKDRILYTTLIWVLSMSVYGQILNVHTAAPYESFYRYYSLYQIPLDDIDSITFSSKRELHFREYRQRVELIYQHLHTEYGTFSFPVWSDTAYVSEEPWVNSTHPVALDLGLSVKWASCNVGANSPAEYGNAYAWGELSPKQEYTKENYAYLDSMGNILPIGDSICGTQYDVATQLWGDGWRMPTEDELKELSNSCTWFKGFYKGIFGVIGTSPNGHTIFLPVNDECKGLPPEYPYASGTKPLGYNTHKVLEFGWYTAVALPDENFTGLNPWCPYLYNLYIYNAKFIRPVKDE